MMVQAIAFYVFASVTIASAAMVIGSRNPVHSVLFLILAFFNSAGLFVLMGAEYLAMTLVIVYVGAVAVLFLFVVMMLDINFVQLRQGFLQYLPIGGLIGLVLILELLMVVSGWVISPADLKSASVNTQVIDGVSNTLALGRLIYTKYVYLFQASGLILLIAMLGAIVLTLRQREGVKRQRITAQLDRKPEEAIEIIDVKTGSGV
ncbi:MAG: NADH-quinone oxidoreductase subunit J [Pseudomonadota bacterium]|nr:NADH-quinone oxidoreductase subunit J [Pseudomonadota bacterium]